MDIYRKQFGTQLRLALEAAGKTQAWLAEKMEVKAATVSRWVNGKDFPKNRVEKIAKFLEMTESQLIGASPMPVPARKDLVTPELLAQILPKILAMGPAQRGLVLYYVFEDQKYLEPLSQEAHLHALQLVKEV